MKKYLLLVVMALITGCTTTKTLTKSKSEGVQTAQADTTHVVRQVYAVDTVHRTVNRVDTTQTKFVTTVVYKYDTLNRVISRTTYGTIDKSRRQTESSTSDSTYHAKIDSLMAHFARQDSVLTQTATKEKVKTDGFLMVIHGIMYLLLVAILAYLAYALVKRFLLK
jgi:uncharacterized protein YceK